MDEIQQPIITPNPVITAPITTPPEEKEVTTPYIVEGLVVGIVLAVAIIGGLYYKSQLSASINRQNAQSKQLAEEKKQQQQLRQILEKREGITPIPTATPITIRTKEELDTQETVLEDMDMSDITKSLEETASDSSEFAP